MKTINSPYYDSVKETHHLKLGNFYFFETFVIAEIKESMHVDLKSSQEFIKICKQFYKDKPFGYISNRINQFSVSPIEFGNYGSALESVISFCSITYNNHFDIMNVEIEKRFAQRPFQTTSNLEDAVDWTNKIFASKNSKVSA